jgi:hypothetical protein
MSHFKGKASHPCAKEVRHYVGQWNGVQQLLTSARDEIVSFMLWTI